MNTHLVKTHLIKTAVTTVAMAYLLAFGLPVQASDVLNPPTKAAKHKNAKKAGQSNGANAKFIPGSAETKKERSARLTRECKGEVNAGACTGYTR